MAWHIDRWAEVVAWEWAPKEGRDDARPNSYWQGRELGRKDLENLKILLNRKAVGKEWATADMSSEFGDIRHDLQAMYTTRKAFQSTKTQQLLWLDQLKASGNAPSTEVNETFVVHTMLILISRMIYYSGTKYDEEKITEGFVNWVNMDQMDRLKSIIDRYNWRQQSGDILRSLYHDYVPDIQRKIYGEYYTPDWLADLICQKVIDDDFIQDQIGNYNAGKPLLHVVDPCCGSGTFLYHAAKRILESKPRRTPEWSARTWLDLHAASCEGSTFTPWRWRCPAPTCADCCQRRRTLTL